MSHATCQNPECGREFVLRSAQGRFCQETCRSRFRYLQRRAETRALRAALTEASALYLVEFADTLASLQREREALTKQAKRRYNQRYYLENLEVIKVKSAEWREANREACARRTAVWRTTDPERARESRRSHYERHKARRLEANRRWRAANAEAVRESRRRREAREKSVVAVHFTVAKLDERFAYFGNRCWMCGAPADTADHVKPLALGGSHMLANLRPACKRCNSSKRASWYGVRGLSRFIRVDLSPRTVRGPIERKEYAPGDCSKRHPERW